MSRFIEPGEKFPAKLLHPSAYIKAAELRGNDVTIRIDRVEIDHELKSARGTELKPCIHFSSNPKHGIRASMMVLNATNRETIEGIYGEFVDEWIGKYVTLYEGRARNPNGGAQVPCVRIRPRAPESKKAEQADAVLGGDGEAA